MRSGWLVLAALAAVSLGGVERAQAQEEADEPRFQRARIEGNRLVLRGEESAPAAPPAAEEAAAPAADVEPEQNAGAEEEANAGAEAESNAGAEAESNAGAESGALAGAGTLPTRSTAEEAAEAEAEAQAEAEAESRLAERQAAAETAVDRAAAEEAAIAAAEAQQQAPPPPPAELPEELPGIDQPLGTFEEQVAEEELAEEGDAARAAEAAEAAAEAEALAAEEPLEEAPELATEIPIEGEEQRAAEELTPEERRELAVRAAAEERARRMNELIGVVNQLGENQEILDQRTTDLEAEQEALRETGVGIEESRLARIAAYEEAEARVRDLADFLATGGGTGADAQMAQLALSLGELAQDAWATSGEEEAQYAVRAQEMLERSRAHLAQGDLFNARMFLVGAADALLTARSIAETTAEPLFREGTIEQAPAAEGGTPGY